VPLLRSQSRSRVGGTRLPARGVRFGASADRAR
jgi:hypothetical protein